ncbi:unnamed protein product [Owenia fusiformis]|uniref:Uncharacterized protein n=1 Tax=Owenia fusiformis TaxID=6347 RepID=A0A8J1UEJ3_OWEFU|nr:unnamed protein product [Owenia fusiformis]
MTIFLPGNNESVLKNKENVMDCMQLLIQHGASVKARDNDADTVLMYAVKGGFVDCCRVLIHYGADVNAINNMGQTGLSMACSLDSFDSFDLYCTFYIMGARDDQFALLKSIKYSKEASRKELKDFTEELKTMLTNSKISLKYKARHVIQQAAIRGINRG